MIWLLACAAHEEPAVDLSPWTGSAACAGCHPREARIWSTSGHAHALQTLKLAWSSHNPSCLRCHTVGFGEGGWPKAGLADVGCEACHGAGAAHAADPTAPWPTPDNCTGCHTADTSPDFDRAARWAMIAH